MYIVHMALYELIFILSTLKIFLEKVRINMYMYNISSMKIDLEASILLLAINSKLVYSVGEQICQCW